MNPLFWLFGIVKAFKEFEANILKQGWSRGCNTLIKDLGISVQSNLVELPSKGPLLVYANHPTGLDPYILSGVFKRDDVYYLSDIYQTLKGKNIASHILPVFYTSWSEFLKRPLTSWPGYILMRILTGTTSKREAKIRNQKTIERAVNLLKKGSLILIFPSGGNKGKRSWKPGIGKIIIECRNRGIKAQLFAINIMELDEIKLFRHFLFGRRYYNRNKISINGRIVLIDKYDNFSDPFVLSQELKKEYMNLIAKYPTK